MKVAVLGSGGVELRDQPSPRAGAGELLVELAACGICGTDLEKLRGNYRSAGILGHEAVGRIAEVGDGVTGRSVGERVFVHHHVPCLECEICRRGDLTYCASYARTNLDPGGFAEVIRVSEAHVRRGAVLALADGIGWDVGTLLEPAGCALTALRRVGFREGDSVFVVGLGPVGLLYAALARALGARWVGGSDLSERRRVAGRDLGLDATVDARDPAGVETAVHAGVRSGGLDLSVAAVGAPAAIRLAAVLPRRGGTLNLFGLPDARSRLDVDLQELYLRGTRIVPSYATTEREIFDIHDLVRSGKLSIGGIVSHRFPLAEVAGAFDKAAKPEECLKVVVTGPAYARS